MKPFDCEKALEYPVVIGCDEVGRGALCGPVLVAAVWFEPCHIPRELLSGLDDSKRLSRTDRERLALLIRDNCKVSVAASSCKKIDRLNIRGATLDAMRRAVAGLGDKYKDYPSYFDGRDIPDGICGPAKAVVKGDQTVPQIAAASIIAKTVRDRLMISLGRRYPAYGWESNAGYGAKIHMEAIGELGATPHHRMSFSPLCVVQLGLDL